MKTRAMVAFVVVLGWAGVCSAGWLKSGPWSDLSGFVPIVGSPTAFTAQGENRWVFSGGLIYTNEFYQDLAAVQLAGGTVIAGSTHGYGGAVMLWPGATTYDTDGTSYGGRLELDGGSVGYHYWDVAGARDRYVTAYGPRMYFDPPGSSLTNASNLGSLIRRGSIRILGEGLTLNGNAVLTTSNAASGFMIRYGTQLVFVAGTVTNVIDSDLVTP